MALRNFFKWGLLFVAIMVYKHADALELPEGVFHDDSVETTRVPDHFAYYSLMKELSEIVDRKDRNQAVTTISRHLSLDLQQSDEFLNYVLNSYRAFESSNRTLTDRMMCQGKQLDSDEKVYRLMDTLDDIKETNLKKYYKHALIKLGKNSAGELDLWLAAAKNESGIYSYDHQRMYEEMDLDVNIVIAVACNHLAAYYR